MLDRDKELILGLVLFLTFSMAIVGLLGLAYQILAG